MSSTLFSAGDRLFLGYFRCRLFVLPAKRRDMQMGIEPLGKKNLSITEVNLSFNYLPIQSEQVNENSNPVSNNIKSVLYY